MLAIAESTAGAVVDDVEELEVDDGVVEAVVEDVEDVLDGVVEGVETFGAGVAGGDAPLPLLFPPP